jgi:hypothetical protein
MNWRLLIEATGAGFLASLAAYFCADQDFVWQSMSDFKPLLMLTIVFAAVFSGIVYALPIFLYEKKAQKFLKRFLFAASAAAVLTASGVIFYRLLMETYFKLHSIQGKADRLLWWIVLGTCLSSVFGLLGGGFRNWGRAIMAIVPTIVVMGSVIDRGALMQASPLLSFLLCGAIIGLGYGLVWDLLRESWLDELETTAMPFRYYLDSESLWVGSSMICDITIDSEPELSFKITEKDGMHILEILSQDTVKLNNNRVKYKILEEGDVIRVGSKAFVYRTRMVRTRDVIPEFVG